MLLSVKSVYPDPVADPFLYDNQSSYPDPVADPFLSILKSLIPDPVAAPYVEQQLKCPCCR